MSDIKNLVKCLIDMFDFVNDIVFQLNNILNYKDEIDLVTCNIASKYFDKLLLIKYTNISNCDNYGKKIIDITNYPNLNTNETIAVYNIKLALLNKKIIYNLHKFDVTLKDYHTENICVLGNETINFNVSNKKYDYKIHDNMSIPFLINFLNNQIIVYSIANNIKISVIKKEKYDSGLKDNTLGYSNSEKSNFKIKDEMINDKLKSIIVNNGKSLYDIIKNKINYNASEWISKKKKWCHYRKKYFFKRNKK